MKRRKPAELARRRSDESEDVGEILRESALSAAHLLAEAFPALRAQVSRLIERDEKGNIVGVTDPMQVLAIASRAGEFLARAAGAAAVAQLSRDAGVDDPIIVGLPDLDEPERGEVIEIEAEARR